MNKTQLKALTTQIHGLAAKSASGKKTAQNKTTQNRAMEKIATLINQTIEAEVKQAYTDMAARVRGLAEKLDPKAARKAVGKKKGIQKKPVATKRKPQARRGRIKPAKEVVEPSETSVP